MYKAYNNLLPPQLQNCFKQVYVTSVLARTNNNFQVNFTRTNVKAMCVSNRGIKLWNNLENVIKIVLVYLFLREK